MLSPAEVRSFMLQNFFKVVYILLTSKRVFFFQFIFEHEFRRTWLQLTENHFHQFCFYFVIFLETLCTQSVSQNTNECEQMIYNNPLYKLIAIVLATSFKKNSILNSAKDQLIKVCSLHNKKYLPSFITIYMICAKSTFTKTCINIDSSLKI